MMLEISKKTRLLALGTVALVLLAGCRDDEQNRRTTFEPGVYQGKQDDGLGQETLMDLRSRTAYQIAP